MATSAASLELIPDNILLEILNYLPVKDLCIAGRVCSRWRRIVNDKSLWRHVDLSMYKLNLQKMWKVIRAHFSDVLLSIKFRGFKDYRSPKYKRHSVSAALLEDLNSRCPNIREFHLHYGTTDNIPGNKLPQQLTVLTLRQCYWTPRWFQGMDTHFTNLRHLDLTDTARVDNFDLEDISMFTKLETLNLNGCYRVGEIGLQKIAQSLTNLESLSISESQCTDLALHHISQNLKQLRQLNIVKIRQFSESSLGEISSGFKNLEILCISGINITPIGLLILKQCKNLRKLVICNFKVPAEQINTIKEQFPRCDVQVTMQDFGAVYLKQVIP